VRSIDAKRLRSYLSRNHRAPAMVVAAAGGVDHDAMIAEAEQRFSNCRPGARPPPAVLRGAYEKRSSAGPYRVGAEACRSAILDLVCSNFTNIPAACPRACSRRSASSVAVYSIYAFHSPYVDTGLSVAGTDAIDAPELMRVGRGEIAAAADTITEEEVARAKAQMKVGLLMALESSSAAEQRPARFSSMAARSRSRRRRQGRRRPSAPARPAAP
jgi:predicted Zn-dependent peptidase